MAAKGNLKEKRYVIYLSLYAASMKQKSNVNAKSFFLSLRIQPRYNKLRKKVTECHDISLLQQAQVKSKSLSIGD